MIKRSASRRKIGGQCFRMAAARASPQLGEQPGQAQTGLDARQIGAEPLPGGFGQRAGQAGGGQADQFVRVVEIGQEHPDQFGTVHQIKMLGDGVQRVAAH
jgi:hypothetical protein